MGSFPPLQLICSIPFADLADDQSIKVDGREALVYNDASGTCLAYGVGKSRFHPIAGFQVSRTKFAIIGGVGPLFSGPQNPVPSASKAWMMTTDSTADGMKGQS